MTAMRAHGDHIHCIYGDMHFTISLKALNIYIESSINAVEPELSSDSNESKNDQPGTAPGQVNSSTASNDEIPVTQPRFSHAATMERLQSLYVSFWFES